MRDYDVGIGYGFALLCWSLVLGPAVLALYHWNAWWLLLYIVVGCIFGLS